jgi:hypothetical protein
VLVARKKDATTARTAAGKVNEETVKAPPIGPGLRYSDAAAFVVEGVQRVTVVVYTIVVRVQHPVLIVLPL